MRTIVTAALLLLPAACMVGPDYEKPKTESPDRWGDAQGALLEAGPADLATWWKSFGDSTLDSLVVRAIGANLDLKGAMARVREARAEAGYSRGALLPEVAAGGSYTRERLTENGRFPTGGKPEGNLYRAGFDAAWEIDLFGGTRRSMEAADAELEAAVEDRRAVLVSLLGEVASAYVDLRGAQRLAGVYRRNTLTAKGTLDLMKTRLAAGLATELDVARAESQLATTESQVPEAERSIRVAIHRLGTLIARDPGSLSRELEAEAAIPAPPAKILVGVPSEIVGRRPDLRRAERKAAAATARIGVATADLYPKFSVTGAFGLESVDASDFAKAASKAWSVGPSVRWPIFSGGRILNNIEVADARAEQAILAYRQAILGAFEEVENSIVGYLREWDRRRSLQAAAAASRRTVTLANDLYRKGLTSFLDVLDGERSLYEAERRLAESEAALTLAVVSLYKSLGGGWESATID